MAQNSTCLFCKIAAEAISCAKVHETEHAVAFLDINPVNKGHVLVIPKEHFATLPEMTDEVAANTAAVLPRVARAVAKATAAEGMNIIVNVGEVAGQTVHHVHWHIIPRHAGDHVRWPWPHESYGEGEMARIHEAIAKAVTG